MPAVTAVHEKVHPNAGQQQQAQKPVAGKDVNAVLEPQ